MSQTQNTKKKDYDLEHMPNFIKDAPWYMRDQQPENDQNQEGNDQQNEQQQDDEKILFHQRRTNKDKKQSFDNWYKRGLKPSESAASKTDKLIKRFRGGIVQAKSRSHVSKFEKGACTNCGATTHHAKECTERPRKLGAKFSHKNIARDEYDTNQQQVKLNFESKRDRWNGYNPDFYQKDVIKKWEIQDQLVNEMQEERAKAAEPSIGGKDKQKEQGNEVYSSDSDDDEKDEEGMGATFKSADPKVKTMQKDLRLREDTAKYLLNLDPNSAPYDPKSRTLKENPNPGGRGQFKGDNYVKISGDYLNLIQNEGYMLEFNKRAEAQGSTLIANTVAMPSQFELLKKEYEKKKGELQVQQEELIKEKYKNQNKLDDVQEQKLLELQQLEEQLESQMEQKKLYEQSRLQMLIAKKELMKKKEEAQTKQSNIGLNRGAEDKFAHKTHEACWGSHWHPKFGWGYKCCYSHDMDNKRCGGEAGKQRQIHIYNPPADKPIEPEKVEEAEDQVEKRQRHDSDSD